MNHSLRDPRQSKPVTQITVDQLLTSNGRFPDRKALASLSDLENARDFVDCVNLVLRQIEYKGKADITSGYRPPAVNAATPGAAKGSAHQRCLAADFDDQDLGRAIRAHQDGAYWLRNRGLFMERLESTTSANGGWTHVDRAIRADRPNREFAP